MLSRTPALLQVKVAGPRMPICGLLMLSGLVQILRLLFFVVDYCCLRRVRIAYGVYLACREGTWDREGDR